MSSRDTIRIAALGDLHYSRANHAEVHAVFAQIPEAADVVILCGDLTDYGLPDEAKDLARLLTSVKRPMVAVLGNHDFESGKQDEVRAIVAEAGVTVLDGETCEILGIGFAGVKGFAGGFGRGVLGPWGEESIKRFVHEAVDEALKLETALARLRTATRITLMHYAPIRDTVEGEPLEIFPYLGCSRLEEPLTRYPVTAVFHGHAHHGQLEGRTSTGVPVYNVSLRLLRQAFPLRPFRITEVPGAAQLTMPDLP